LWADAAAYGWKAVLFFDYRDSLSEFSFFDGLDEPWDVYAYWAAAATWAFLALQASVCFVNGILFGVALRYFFETLDSLFWVLLRHRDSFLEFLSFRGFRLRHSEFTFLPFLQAQEWRSC
jgi:hypothetical protein